MFYGQCRELAVGLTARISGYYVTDCPAYQPCLETNQRAHAHSDGFLRPQAAPAQTTSEDGSLPDPDIKCSSMGPTSALT